MTAPQEMTRETLEHIRSQWASGSTVIGITFKQLTAIADMALASLSADKVLVPREPTEEMIKAVIAEMGPMVGTPERLADPFHIQRMQASRWDAAERYCKAMLSAAPQPNAVPLDDGSLRKLFKSATGYTPEEYEQMLREVKR